MAEPTVSTPSTGRLLVFCLLSGIGALLVVMGGSVNAWFMFPVGIVILAVLSLLDGYWAARS